MVRGGRKESSTTGWVWHGQRGFILNGAGVGRQKDLQREETTKVAAKALKGSQARAGETGCGLRFQHE